MSSIEKSKVKISGKAVLYLASSPGMRIQEVSSRNGGIGGRRRGRRGRRRGKSYTVTFGWMSHGLETSGCSTDAY